MYKIFSLQETTDSLSDFAKRPEIYMLDIKPCKNGLVVYYKEDVEE